MIFFTSPPPSSAGIYPTPPHNNTAQRSFAEIARYSYNTDMHFTLNISKTVSTILPMNNTTNELTSGLRRSPGPSYYCILIQLPQREPQYSSLETPQLRSVGIQQLTIYPSDTTDVQSDPLLTVVCCWFHFRWWWLRHAAGDDAGGMR